MSQERKVLQVKLLANIAGKTLSQVESEMNQLLSEGWECDKPIFDRAILFQKMVKYAPALKQEVKYITTIRTTMGDIAEKFRQAENEVNELLKQGWIRGELKINELVMTQVMLRHKEADE